MSQHAEGIAPFSLLTSPWLPFTRADGTTLWASPAAIARPDITGLAWPRPDFNLAAHEFLIGLLTTAMAPEEDTDWRALWRTPPTEAELAARFAPFAPAFQLDGPGPRFLQDLEDLASDPNPVETLLIDAPSGLTATQFVKPDRVRHLSRAAAAMALFTLQCYAPAGGRGNLTSLRGGGPMTTLVIPGGDPGLWRRLWANVPRRDWQQPTGPDPLVFPWMAPTITSEARRAVTPLNSHPLQQFWGMPRRIRLDFAGGGVPCDLGGPADSVRVVGWRQRPYGARYEAWQHVLSPYYRMAKEPAPLPMHPQPGGIGYRHWLGLVAEQGAERLPARSVLGWKQRVDLLRREAPRHNRLLAGGYDMDNMKARGFVESEMPLPTLAEGQGALDDLARHLVLAAQEVRSLLRLALRIGLGNPDMKPDATLLTNAEAEFWAATEPGFYALLERAAGLLEPDTAADLTGLRQDWLHRLRRAALALFDTTVPLEKAGLRPVKGNGERPPEVAGRSLLLTGLNGYGKAGTALFAALGLAPPASAKPARRKKEPTPA